MYGDMPGLFGIWWVFIIFVIWSIIWKGLALWKSARLCHKWWFVALLIINTVGILEILYIYVFSKRMKACDNCDCCPLGVKNSTGENKI